MYCNIAIDVPLRRVFTYRVAADQANLIKRGSRVIVPFGSKKLIGICLAVLNKKPENIEENKLKEIIKVCEDALPLLSENYLRWLELAAEYYATPLGQVMAQALPSYYFKIKKSENSKPLRSKKIKSFQRDYFHHHVQNALTEDQQEIFSTLLAHSEEYYPALVHGITGSGKTEIYIHLLKENLKKQKSALYLVPEIGLTSQTLSRLHQHFPKELLVYHSALTENQKLMQWQACLQEKPQIMVGTRSALFAPFANLGLVIIDEEHDTSFKQEDRFRYHARDLAVLRAHLLKIPVVMGSATPSLESYYLSQQKKYHYFELQKRFLETELPAIKIIHVGKEKQQTNMPLILSQHIHQAIDYYFEKRQQMIIFAGQRGYAQNAYCTACAKIQLCSNCSVGLTFHKPKKILKCHYCDFEKHFDEICFACLKKSLTLLGSGTQSIEEEIQSLHPQLKLLRMDSDNMSSVQKIDDALAQFSQQKINLLIGTQMLAKGHDFKNVGFVGVVNIDAHLGLPDFRASERSFQTLVQVAGRAGREKKRGAVMVQSYYPEHPSLVLGAQHDYKKFAQHELELRQQLFYPPYSRIIQLKFISNHLVKLHGFFKEWQKFLMQLQSHVSPENMKLLGPAPMPLEKIRGKYRYHFIIKLKRGLKTKDIINYLLEDLEKRNLSGVQFQVDVDPVNLL